MKVWKDESQYDLGASAVVLGMFDGLHIGHQKLIRTARELADRDGLSCVVSTFDRHPLSVLRPEKVPMRLISPEDRLARFARMGVDGVILKSFTREFADTQPEDYLRELCRSLKAKAIIAGFNYTFGAGGRGNAEMICGMSSELGYKAVILQPVTDDGDIVSSTLIRSLISAGDLTRAERLMQIE